MTHRQNVLAPGFVCFLECIVDLLLGHASASQVHTSLQPIHTLSNIDHVARQVT